MSKDERPSIEDALKKVRKQYGESAVMYDDSLPESVDTVPTGSYALDYVMGNGLPRGRIIELFGHESSGKSTMCSFIISQIQKRGGQCAYIDAEQAFDAEYATKIGVDTKKLYLAQTGTLEECMDIVRAFISTNQIDLIVIDSVAALTPKAEAEAEEMLKPTMGLQARLIGTSMRILSPMIGKSKTTVIFINQMREKIGAWGNPETTPGGKALKYFASIRLQVKKKEIFEGKNKERIGNEIEITAVKNKVAPPFRKRTVNLYYGSGIDLNADLFDEAVERGVISKSGNTYTYHGEKIGVGREDSLGGFAAYDSAIVRKEVDEVYAKK
jgi:recombination protein RecA